ncbi:MAG: hypothetical protein AABY95_00510 [Pseudomonadota bacterium]
MKTILVALVSASLAACAASQRIAMPGQVFEGSYIHIEAPTNGTWEIISDSSSGMVFAKGDRSTSETFVAAVAIFGLPPTNTKEEFVSLVRESVNKDTDPARFEMQNEHFQHTSERPYSCIRHQSVAKDKAPAGPIAPLWLEMYALYCRHPVQPESGFSVVYSHRGSQLYPNLRQEAEKFIQGVRAPGSKSANILGTQDVTAAAPQGTSRVIFFNTSNSWLYNDASAIQISIDGRKLSHIKMGEFVQTFLVPGTHTLNLKHRDVFLFNDDFSLEVPAGELFVRVFNEITATQYEIVKTLPADFSKYKQLEKR